MEIYWTPIRNGHGRDPRPSDDAGMLRGAERRAEAFVPRADVFETRDDLVVELELPGHELRDITVEIEEHLLTVRVERKPTATAGRTYYRSERPEGTIARSFTLPTTVNCEGTRASYRNGVLTVQLPKIEEAKPRKIPILTGD